MFPDISTNSSLKMPYISLNPSENTSIRELFISWIDKYINKVQDSKREMASKIIDCS